MADTTKWEVRALGTLSEIRTLLTAEETQSVINIHSMNESEWQDKSNTETPMCAGNQHTCMPTVYVPSLDKRFNLVLTGKGDSVVVGHHLGPRALIWKNTELSGTDSELGKITVRLEASADNAGTMIPLVHGSSFPAFNRNTYFFVFHVDGIGEMISDRPAIVEALIAAIPPTATYVFKNGPLNFYRRGDSARTTVMILEHASTHVKP